MNDRDTGAADDWIRDHMPDPEHFSFEDNEAYFPHFGEAVSGSS